MDHAVNENDVHRQIAGFNFDKPIKVTCIIMDDETDNAKNSLDTNKPVQYAASVINSTNSETQILNTTVRHENCSNDVNFNRNRAIIGHEPHIVADEAMQYDRNVRNTQKVPDHNDTSSSLRKLFNMVNSMTSHIHLTPDEKILYQNSLDSVSNNLINVTRYYHFYNMRYMGNRSVMEKYIDYKNRYYSLSYNIVVSILLPQEHNQSFIDNFILRTIELGNREGWYHLMNVKALGVLVKDMIKWTKRRKMYQEEREHHLPQPMCGQPVPIVPSTLPLVPPVATVSSSNNIYDVYKQEQLSRPPQVSALLCLPVLTQVSPTLPVPPSSNSNINVNIRYPMRRAPAVLFVPTGPPIPPMPSISNNISNANIHQQINGLPTISPTQQLNRQPPVSPSQQLNRRSPVSPVQQLFRLPPVSPVQQLNRPPPISPAQQLHKPPPVSPIQQLKRHLPDLPTQQLNRPSPVLPVQQLFRLPPVSPVQQLRRPPVSPVLSVQKSHDHKRAPPEGHKNNICLFTTGPPGSAISISIDPSVAKTVSGEKVRKDSQNLANKKRKRHDNPRNGDILVTNDTCYPPMQNHLPHNNISPNEASRTSTADVMNTTMQTVNNHNQFCPGERRFVNAVDNNECQPLLSRSVSRDSGFGSPVLCSLLNNNDYSMAYPCTDNQDFTPNIAHVTSLNPGALHIASGSCKICGSTTNNVCIVCYNEYYCGYVCQNIDWPVHKEICRGQ